MNAEAIHRLRDIVGGRQLDVDALARTLDELPVREQVAFVRTLDRHTQAELFEASAGRPTSLADIVPRDVKPLVEVICEGRNSLPVFKFFQKRFCRSPDHPLTELWGYNEQALRPLTGPGYFVAYEAAGEVAIDYTRLPAGKPHSWPDVQPNERGVSRWVYAGMVDFVRKVSSRVLVGRAWRHGKPRDNWFVLCRLDPSTGASEP